MKHLRGPAHGTAQRSVTGVEHSENVWVHFLLRHHSNTYLQNMITYLFAYFTFSYFSIQHTNEIYANTDLNKQLRFLIYSHHPCVVPPPAPSRFCIAEPGRCLCACPLPFSGTMGSSPSRPRNLWNKI